MKKDIFLNRNYINLFNLPNLAFISTFILCIFILFISSIFELHDYSSTIGFSSKVFNYNLFIDGVFYKDSFDFYSNWRFLTEVGKNFISGPIVPLIFVKLSFENLTILFILFSFLISSSVYIWSKIICTYFTNKRVQTFLILIILLNPYNFYFVLKPGSEIPFQLFYAIFNLCFLSMIFHFNQYINKKSKNLLIFKFYFYSTLITVFFLLLTRPTALMVVCSLFLLTTYILITKFNGINHIKNELFIVNSILLTFIIYFSFLYYEYASLGLKWLEGNPEALIQFSNQVNPATYFGISETNIKFNLRNFPFLLKQIFYFLWKISNWILGISGIRDSFSLINNETAYSEMRISQVILRVSYGLFIYLPILLANIFISFYTLIYKFFKVDKLKFNSPFNLISLISISIILPNIIFYSNERYIFMIFPSLLISFVYTINRNLAFKKSSKRIY